MSSHPIPVIPESAPFTAEQRAYLNGFLAGLFSHVPAPTSTTGIPAPSSAKPMEPLAVLFGSQTGTSEKLAKRIAKEAGKRGFAPTLHDLAKYPVDQITTERNLLIVTSTYGDGDPPDNAKGFWDFLKSDRAPKLSSTRFSLLALGDSNYAKFCGFGKELDSQFEKLGAQRVHPREDCDVDYEEAFLKWLNGAIQALGQSLPAAATSQGPETPEPEESGYSKSRPFRAKLLTQRRLTASGSGKDVRHFEIGLHGSGMSYDIGDALGVWPTNSPAQVEELIRLLDLAASEPVTVKPEGSLPLVEALTRVYEISRIPQPLLLALAQKTGDELLTKLTSPSANGELSRFLWGREIVDLLLQFPQARFTAAEFVGCLKKLQPRLYSISSSPKAHPDEVHLTVGFVKYESLGRSRKGVCSSFLAERVDPTTPLPVFVHQNNAFRPPAADKPLIMVGPGTGIAPFRAYLEERRAIAATGKNWLFFGDQRAATDFLYREEIETFQQQGYLHRLDLAWSRDQEQKIYVQQRMLESADQLYAWLEEGAGFYVCGDASRMAKDVETALHQVVEKAGGKSPEQAAAYVQSLKSEKRYLRDVY